MPKGPAQLRAKLRWEAACERLRNSLQPPRGAPFGTAAERIAAYLLAQEALEEVRETFDIDPEAHPGSLSPPKPNGPQPDGPAAGIDGS